MKKTLLALVVFSTVFQVWSGNKIAVEGNRLYKIEEEISRLQDENASIERKIVSWSSITNLSLLSLVH